MRRGVKERNEVAVLAECEQYGEEVRRATENRNAAILAARDAGVSLGRIAGATGLTRQAVTYIVERAAAAS